jgi:hypothetical protein
MPGGPASARIARIDAIHVNTLRIMAGPELSMMLLQRGRKAFEGPVYRCCEASRGA